MIELYVEQEQVKSKAIKGKKTRSSDSSSSFKEEILYSSEYLEGRE